MGAKDKVGILVGGGPAPGINSVIAAAAIRCILRGYEVVGLQDGFSGIMHGGIHRSVPLRIEDVSRIHFRGGSVIGISRANPTADDELLENCVLSLQELGITKLITIGGDDTAFSSMKVEEKSEGRVSVVHVPKTIDNDLDLPYYVDTFGYKTARHVGAELCKNLMVDAFTTSRWYFVIAMGRKAGHLALGIGKAAGSTITLIPEEFGTERVPFATLVDTLAGAVIKRKAEGRNHGVAVIAEGVALSIDPDDLGGLEEVEKDAHGHTRIAEIDVGHLLKKAVRKRLDELGVKVTIVDKNIGYELRCADPIPSDMEYTRDLGYCAARYLLEGGTRVMVSMQADKFVPVPFEELIDPASGRTKVRLVDTHSARYLIARRYMIRIRKDDFDNRNGLERIAAQTNLSVSQFKEEFEYLTDLEPPPLQLMP